MKVILVLFLLKLQSELQNYFWRVDKRSFKTLTKYIGGSFGSIILALFLKIPIVIFVCFLVLIDVSESPTDEKKPIDIYAIGFEEMVDLDAKNIMNTR